MELVGPGFRSGEVDRAEGWLRRLRGLMGRPPRPLLLATRSVHGFWLREPLWAVALDPESVVVAVRVLTRRRVLVFPRAAAVLELPLTTEPPACGIRLRWTDSAGLP